MTLLEKQGGESITCKKALTALVRTGRHVCAPGHGAYAL